MYDHYFWIILGMGLVTFIPRWLPLFVLSRLRMPRPVVEWLDFIPVSILSALVAPAILQSGPSAFVDLWRPEVAAAVPTFIIAIVSRSLGATVISGMLVFWGLSRLWGG